MVSLSTAILLLGLVVETTGSIFRVRNGASMRKPHQKSFRTQDVPVLPAKDSSFSVKSDSYLILLEYSPPTSTSAKTCSTLKSMVVYAEGNCIAIQTSSTSYPYTSMKYIFSSTDDDTGTVNALNQNFYLNFDCSNLGTVVTISLPSKEDTCENDLIFIQGSSLFTIPEVIDGYYFEFYPYSDDDYVCSSAQPFYATWQATGSVDDDLNVTDDLLDASCLSHTTAFHSSAGFTYYVFAAIDSGSTSVPFVPTSKTSGCFAGSEMVTLESGETMAISNVVRGDRILAADDEGNTKYSTVVAVPHPRDNKEVATFVHLTTNSGADIKLTENHLLMVNSNCDATAPRQLMKAANVEVGMCLVTSNNHELEPVVSSQRNVEAGLYTVVTEEEFIVVNGFVASPFATNHVVGHSYYNIVRMLNRLGVVGALQQFGGGVVGQKMMDLFGSANEIFGNIVSEIL